MPQDTATPKLDPNFDYAQLPDGSYAQFKKGTNPIVMRARLAQAGLIKPKPYAGPVKETKPTYQLPKAYGFTPKNVATNLYEGGKAVVKGTYELGKDVLSNKPLFFGKDSTANKYIGNPGAQQLDKAREDWKANRLLEASAHFVAAHIPFIGPAAANLGEQAGTGDIGGATAQGVGMLATGKALSKTTEIIGKNLDSTWHREQAKNLDTAALKTADATVKDYNRAVGLEVAQKRIMGNLKDLPDKIEQVRAGQDAKVNALAKYHDAQGHTVDAESGLAKPLSVIAQRLNTRGLLDEPSMKAIRSELNKLQTKIDMQTGKPVPRNLKTMTVKDALELTKGLGQKIHWDAATEAAVEPFRKTIRQVINDAIDKVDPEIGKVRESESKLVEARDAARKNYTDALNDKSKLGFRMIYGSMGTIGTYLGLKALGVFPTMAIGSVILLGSMWKSTLSRTVRAAIHAKITDVLDQATSSFGRATGPPNAAGGPQVPRMGQGSTLPAAPPQGAANAATGQPTASPAPSGLSAMPPPPTAATAPRQMTLPESATRARAGSGDYVRGTSGAKSTSKSTAIPEVKVTPEVATSTRNKAMLDRLDTLLARQPRSGAENVAIKREVDEIKKVLSGEAKGADAAAINKRIADRERLAAKRSTATASAPAQATGVGSEAVSQSASPEMRAIALDAGYKALSKYEGGDMMAKALRDTAKAMQKIDPSYDEVEKLTEALQILKSLPPDKD